MHKTKRKMLLLAIVSLFVLSISKANAEEIVYEDDFENHDLNSFPNQWKTTRNIQWNDLSKTCMNGNDQAIWQISQYKNSKRVSITIDGPGCTTEITPSVFKVPDYSNYEISLDISLPESVYKDRSVLFKYNAGDQAYGFTIKDPHKINFFKAVGTDYSNQLGQMIFEKGFEADHTYNMKVRVLSDNITLFIDEQQIYSVQDQEPILNEGTIALQASIGSYGRNTVYFDNVKVTDLSSNPTLLDIPHFSQRDSGWNDEEYDHASAFQAKQNATINNWGCALTSGAMILDYYGYHLSPGGLPTNPSTLNTFLNANNGYTKSGAVIWNYLSTYAKQSKKAHEQYHALPNLELSYRAYNSGAISQGIEAKTPSIIKIITNDKQTPAINDDSMHFVVAKDIQDGDFIINDPWQLQFLPSHTLASLYPQKEYRSYIQFTPKQSDLSYITAIWYDSSVNAVMEHNGKEFGYDMNDDFHQTLENAAIETQSGLANSKSPLENLTSPQENTFHLQQPDKGLYVLNFSSENDRELEYDIRAFNSSGEDATNTQKTMVGSRKPVYIELLFDPQAEEAFATIEEVSFEALKRKVLEYEAAGDIQRHQTSKQIIQAIELAEKHFDSKANARHLDLLQEKLTGNVWKKFISDNVKAELLQMTQKLGSYLKNN